MITTEHLTKKYGTFTAVDDVNFTVEPGRVVGFLGPNGAGKSTAMRMITGLTVPTRGRALIDGKPYAQLVNPARQVGTMLDASAQHPGRTGLETLTLAALQIGVPRSRVGEMLDLVGLSGKEAKRRVRNYSLGMRQRLGLAAAFLGDPHVLILDEPANGLDPQGIHWMRGLLRDFARRGGTVLLSSHLLHEVEAIADELIVISQARIIARGTLDDLLSDTATVVRSLDDDSLATALRQDGHDVTVTPAGLHVLDEPEAIGRVALAHGIVLLELRRNERAGLEDLFLSLTADSDRTAQPAGPSANGAAA
ncbi:MAG TPA: ATP-binding cassette domain-containing protein [Intrasporangiaceae bacterium]|nr:ATP-binding cassette domain-containing protein [Intrasporangiaceae bacterium]